MADTSSHSIEERLVASVWVLERQHTGQTMSQVVFSVWLTQAVTLSRSTWWQVWVHERQYMGQTMSQVMAAFRERFNKAPPWRATPLDWEKRAFALGSVKDRLQSGRKTMHLETCAAVAASIERSPLKSTRKRSSELGVPWSTTRDHMKKDLNVRPYHPTGWHVAAARWGTHTLRSFCARCFEQTFYRALDWPWLTDISCTIVLATT